MNAVGPLFGIGFGVVLSGARLTDYDVIHRMLRLEDLQPFLVLVLGSAIAVAAPLLRLLSRSGWQTPLGGPLTPSPSPIGRHHVLGSILFGAGWAVVGTCPGPALAMVGSGHLLGAVVATGLFAGIALRDTVTAGVTTQRSGSNAGEPQSVGL